jgi:cytochrome b561
LSQKKVSISMNSPPVSEPSDANTVRVSTRLKNNAHGYGLIAIGLHWFVALVLTGMFILGVWMTDLTYYHDWYKRAPDIHKSIGILLFFVIIFRLYWRMSNSTPADEPGTGKLQLKIAHIVHIILYVMIFAMMISGYLISTADGRGIEVFGWFEVPAIPPIDIENLEDRAGEVHWYLALALCGLVGLHASAALKHHFIDRDRTLVKMLGIRSINHNQPNHK